MRSLVRTSFRNHRTKEIGLTQIDPLPATTLGFESLTFVETPVPLLDSATMRDSQKRNPTDSVWRERLDPTSKPSGFSTRQSRNFGRCVGRPSCAFNVAPDWSMAEDYSNLVRGDITDCVVGAFPRAIPARRCTGPPKVRREFREKFLSAAFPAFWIPHIGGIRRAGLSKRKRRRNLSLFGRIGRRCILRRQNAS